MLKGERGRVASREPARRTQRRRDETRCALAGKREDESASTWATRKSLQRPAARQQRRADRDDEPSLASQVAEKRSVASPCLSCMRTRLHSAYSHDEAKSYNTRSYRSGCKLYPVAVYQDVTKSPSSARLFRRGSTAAHTLTLCAGQKSVSLLCMDGQKKERRLSHIVGTGTPSCRLLASARRSTSCPAARSVSPPCHASPNRPARR